MVYSKQLFLFQTVCLFYTILFFFIYKTKQNKRNTNNHNLIPLLKSHHQAQSFRITTKKKNSIIKLKISSLQTISKSSGSEKSSESRSENSNSWYHPRGAGRTKKISKKWESSWRTNGKRKTPGEGWKTSCKDSIHHKILECITENILRYLRYPSWGLKNKREILKQKK